MKGTRNVTAAQTASGEVAQGVRSFFFIVARVYAFFRCVDLKIYFPC